MRISRLALLLSAALLGCGVPVRFPADAGIPDGSPLRPVVPENLEEFEGECTRQRSCADCQQVRFEGYGGCGWDAARGGVCRFGTGPRADRGWWWDRCPTGD